MDGDELDRSVLGELEARVGRERILRVLSVHRRSAQETLSSLALLIESRDRMALKALAHRLSGGAATIGLRRLGERARAVELAAPDVPEEALSELARGLHTDLAASDTALVTAYPELLRAAG